MDGGLKGSAQHLRPQPVRTTDVTEWVETQMAGLDAGSRVLLGAGLSVPAYRSGFCRSDIRHAGTCCCATLALVTDIRSATDREYGAVLTLQRAAFVDEARIYDTPFVPSLDETLDELATRMESSTSWVAEIGGRIVGAVSLRNYRNGGPDVERLMVAPDCRADVRSSA